MHNIGGSFGVRVMRDLCSTCIFRPGNLMSLQRGRVKNMVDEARANGGVIVCHSTLDAEEQAVCRGYADRHSDACAPLQIAQRLGMVVEHDA